MRCLVLLFSVFLAFPALSQQVQSTDVHPETEAEKLKRIGERGIEQANEGTGVATKMVNESPRQKELAESWTNFLPVFGKEARERGYALPAPFGVSLIYLDQRQPFDLLDVQVFLPGSDIPIPPAFATFSIPNLRVHDTTETLRIDSWLLPFLNAYFFFGRTQGQATGDLTVCVVPTPDGCSSTIPNEPFNVKFIGNNTGAGATVAGGISEWFFSADINYTLSDLDISTISAKSLVISARSGWNGDIGIGNASFWLGTVYENIKQTLNITTFPSIPGFPEPRLVVVQQQAAKPLNYVVGGRWNFWDGLEVMVEGSLNLKKNGREQVLGSISYRF